MNILITGVNGFIGKHLFEHLQGTHNLFAISRKTDSSDQNKIISLDLTDSTAVKAKFEESPFSEKIDIIIHCAAVLATPENSTDISLFHQNNIITESIIFIANILKPSAIINLSTIGVYPNADGEYTETTATHPAVNAECLYSLSKLCSEELFTFFLGKTTNVINLRLSQTYGKGMREDRIYSIMKKELELENTITVWGNGERISSFVSIEYFIKTMDQLLLKKDVRGVYNIGETNMSYKELAQMIIEKHGNASSIINYKQEGIRSKVKINSSNLLNVLNS